MPSRFRPGAVAYAKDGRSYVVDDIADGLVYCSSAGGAETEFPEAQLMTEAEWSSRSDARRGRLYIRLKQAPAFTAHKGKIDRAEAERLLARVDQAQPGIFDFTAFTVAGQVLAENGDQDLAPELSIVKCREVYDSASPEVRIALLARLLGTPPEILLSGGKLGDNMLRAMLEKGLAGSADAFEEFSTRRRR